MTAKIDGKQPNMENINNAAVTGGLVNILAGYFSGMGNSIANMPAISETSKATACAVATIWALSSEAVVDIINNIANFFS